LNLFRISCLEFRFSRRYGIIYTMRLLRDRIKGFFLPTFSELSLFMTSLSFILVLFFSQSMRSGLFKFLTVPCRDTRIFALLVFFGAGLALSIFHVFTDRQKSKVEKYAMLFFAVLANAICGILASLHILGISTKDPDAFFILRVWDVLDPEDAPSVVSRIYLILPIWNIINCVLLLVSFRLGWITDKNISDEQTGRLEILAGSLITAAIFVVCQFVFKLYWAITFSICVIYATSFSDAFGSIFYPERRQAALVNLGEQGTPRPADKSETCGLCGRQIPPPETPYVINRRLIVCKQCNDNIQSQK